MVSSSSSSSFKKYNEKKSKEIASLEQELVQSKRWDMKGEIKGQERPENSLLSLSSIIERASKPIPIISQDHTNTIEDIIINRIKNDDFNDVIYKNKNIIDTTTNDDDENINEKSKIGLGQIYENEYTATTTTSTKSNNKNIDSNKEEIKQLFHIISKQLDGLSHFHYTPKPVVNDINITSIKNNNTSIKTILIENINPTNESDANALAPDEIYKKKTGRNASLKADVEHDRDDKKRLRSASKSKKRKEKKQKTTEDTAKAKANIYSKEARKLDEKQVDDIIKTDKRVVIGKNSTEDTSSFTNSKAFFTKVQNLKTSKTSK